MKARSELRHQAQFAEPNHTRPEMIDTNVPGLPYREPCTNPSNLHLAQRKVWVWDMRQALESETGKVDV